MVLPVEVLVQFEVFNPDCCNLQEILHLGTASFHV